MIYGKKQLAVDDEKTVYYVIRPGTKFSGSFSENEI